MKTEQVYVCERCGKYHSQDSRTYFMVMGNILIGKDGGLVGNNLNDGMLINSVVYCTECLIDILEESYQKPVVYRG